MKKNIYLNKKSKIWETKFPKVKSFLIVLTLIIIFDINHSSAAINLAQKLSGQILLQVEQNGEAWYVNPANEKRYFMGRPTDAFKLMRELGIGITNQDLNKIEINFEGLGASDNDLDELHNFIEDAYGTDKNNKDTDGDGYSDGAEVKSGYNPLGNGNLGIDDNFASKQAGKILLQVENNGEAWYVNPNDYKRYFLGRPVDAFHLMRELGLGITDENINQISIYTEPTQTIENPTQTEEQNTDKLMDKIAQAIRSGNSEKTLPYFTENMQKAIEYTMDFLDSEQKFILANIISDTKLTDETENTKTYSTEVYFNGEKHPVNFVLKKQEDGNWLLSNL